MTLLRPSADQGMTRRELLVRASLGVGGALVVAVLDGCSGGDSAVAPTTAPTSAAPAPSTTGATTSSTAATTTSTAAASTDAFAPGPFVAVGRDGHVTVTVHRSEMGQGVRTALAMIVADELQVPWDHVTVVQAPADDRFGGQTTSGSGSVTDSYAPLRKAGATARKMLVAAAASRWGIAPERCRAEQGVVRRDDNTEQVAYGDLVTEAAALTVPATPVLKERAAFRIIGTPVARVDGLDIVTGRAVYGLDVVVPGMRYATIARPPVPGGRVVAHDAAAALAVAGVEQVVTVPSGVAVVATSTWAAIQGRAALAASYEAGANGTVSSASMAAALADASAALAANDGALPADATGVQAIYETAPVAHVAMEPMNTVAHVRADACEIWAPTQNSQAVRDFVQREVGVPAVVHVTLLGGGFGRRLEVDVALEAAHVSKAAGQPVQVVWTRDDDVRHDFYRAPTHHRMSGAVDATGNVVAWRHHVGAPLLNGIVYKGGRQAIEEGLDVVYTVKGGVADARTIDLALPTGPWRAVFNGPNAFARECFFDELAAAAGADPLELRLRSLPPSSALRPVLEAAADAAGWSVPLGAGRGRGVAVHNTYGGTPVAVVAEVTVDAGVLSVDRVVVAVDCGLVVHPDMVVQQIEGGVAYALDSVLHSAVTVEAGAVVESNFDDHPVLAFAEMPVVEVHLLPSDRPPQGVGEMAVPPTAPAVLNAVHAATGRRIRHLPVRPGDLA